MASTEDAAERGERAECLVSGLLGRVMRQRRSVAAAGLHAGAVAGDACELLRAGAEGRAASSDRLVFLRLSFHIFRRHISVDSA